jgi:putative aminopeptidase FrvX
LRGAKTASGKIKPDVFLAIDCSPCADSFGGDEISGKLGEGFLVRFYDPSAIMHQGMKQFIVDLAEEEGVKYQYYKSMGGTDAARVQLQNGGTLVATIGMPARYIHSTTSMIHTDDYEQVKAIVKAIVKRLDWETVERIKANV